MKFVHILNYVSLILVIVILFLTTVGCKKVSYTEKFANSENTELNTFQKQMIESVKRGKIDKELIEKYVKEKKITKSDIDNIVQFVAKYI